MRLTSKIYNSISRNFVALIDRAKMTEYTFLIFLAVLIGLLSGFSAILFRDAIAVITNFFFPGSESLLEKIVASPWYLKLSVPAIGGIIIGAIIYFFKDEAKGHGVTEIMESLILHGGRIRARTTLIRAIAAVITIGTGGSVGREGPVISLGSGIGSVIGRFFQTSTNRLKTLVGCGAAAGLAAAFNVPIAGALFAVEILLHDFTFMRFSPIVVSSVMATVVMHRFEGNFAAFQVSSYQMVSDYELIFYIVLGILCAFVSILFIKALYLSEDIFENRLHLPSYLKPVLGGLSVGIIVIFFPQIMGIGYDTIDNALNDNFIWYIALILIVFKIAATSITLGSGESGGVFVPALFIGAMTGFSFGHFVHSYFPEISSLPGAYALVAMGGLIAGTMHAPITSIIIVFELTYDYHIILPLMITCITSMLISSKFSRESIYTLGLLRKDIQLKDGTEINIMKSIGVKDIFTANIETVNENSTFNNIVDKIISGKSQIYPVINKKRRLLGVITIDGIKEYLYDREVLKDIIIAGDIVEKEIEPVTLQDNCQHVIDKMGLNNIEGLPVVDEKSHALLGMIWRKDINDAYNKEVESREIVSSFARRINVNNIEQLTHIMEGYAITEIHVPRVFIGKSIKEMDIRAKYGVDILLIRTNIGNKTMIKTLARPDYRFSYSDSLVISGEISKINVIKNI